MSYTVIVNEQIAKVVEKIRNAPLKIRLRSAIAQLADNPRPTLHKKLKGKLSEYYRIRVGDYRIIYAISDKRHTIVVIKIGHRKGIY